MSSPRVGTGRWFELHRVVPTAQRPRRKSCCRELDSSPPGRSAYNKPPSTTAPLRIPLGSDRPCRRTPMPRTPCSFRYSPSWTLVGFIRRKRPKYLKFLLLLLLLRTERGCRCSGADPGTGAVSPLVTEAIVACHYFPPGPRLPFQPASRRASPAPNYTAW